MRKRSIKLSEILLLRIHISCEGSSAVWSAPYIPWWCQQTPKSEKHKWESQNEWVKSQEARHGKQVLRLIYIHCWKRPKVDGFTLERTSFPHGHCVPTWLPSAMFSSLHAEAVHAVVETLERNDGQTPVLPKLEPTLLERENNCGLRCSYAPAVTSVRSAANCREQ